MTSASHKKVPLWIKLPYTLLALIIFPVYWREYGPGNFLWFSDIAFFAMVAALWLPSPFISSMMAIGVLPLESIWFLGFFTHGAFMQIADYMFDDAYPLWLRGLSLFHFPMPAAVIYMIWKYGYDPRALGPQIALTVIVSLLTYFLTDPAENINMMFVPENWTISQPLYMTLMIAVLVFCMIIPMHFLLKKWRLQ